MMYVSRTLRMQTWFDNQSASEGKDDMRKPHGIIHISPTVHGENAMWKTCQCALLLLF